MVISPQVDPLMSFEAMGRAGLLREEERGSSSHSAEEGLECD